MDKPGDFLNELQLKINRALMVHGPARAKLIQEATTTAIYDPKIMSAFLAEPEMQYHVEGVKNDPEGLWMLKNLLVHRGFYDRYVPIYQLKQALEVGGRE